MTKMGEPGYWWRWFWKRMALAAFVMPFLALYDLIRDEGPSRQARWRWLFVVLWAIAAAILSWQRMWPFRNR